MKEWKRVIGGVFVVAAGSGCAAGGDPVVQDLGSREFERREREQANPRGKGE